MAALPVEVLPPRGLERRGGRWQGRWHKPPVDWKRGRQAHRWGRWHGPSRAGAAFSGLWDLRAAGR
eukprot:3745932-Alexandrium_andersonii.AAC.1